MPWSDDQRGGLHAPTVWRAVIVGLALALAFVVVGIVVLFRSNREAIDSTRDLSCRIGAFFVGTPIQRQPDQSRQDFEETVHKAESFLRALKAEDCTAVRGASISAEEINRALHKLHRATPDKQAQGGGALSGGSPPGQPGGQEPPEPPGSNPPPPEPPPTPDCTVEVNELGQRICIDLPVP